MNQIDQLCFRFDAVRPAPPLAGAVAGFLSPEAIGFFHVISGIEYASQALGAAPAIHRLKQDLSSGAVGHLELDTRTTRKQRHSDYQALAALTLVP